MSRILAAFLALTLATSLALANPPQGDTDYASVVTGLTDVAWSTTPNDVVRKLNPNVGIVWLGRIESIEIAENPDKSVTLEFLCRHLMLVHPDAQALRQEPFRVRDQKSGYFVITLSSPGLTVDQGRNLQAELAARTHFALVGGHPVHVREVHGEKSVFIRASRSFMSDTIRVVLEPEQSAPL